ncbi:hypothetical protein [Streptomyces sp. NPDC092903]|uniref:hypothetical protein n=1 Tax=Streptomyces sp. NPDC092903 TaxID=3366017 RepID=UPI003801CD7A
MPGADLASRHRVEVAAEGDQWAWKQHTHTVARRSGHTLTAAEDASLLHDQLLLSVDQIATLTGTEPVAVTALLAAARR